MRFCCEGCDRVVAETDRHQMFVRFMDVSKGVLTDYCWNACPMCRALAEKAVQPRNWPGSPLEVMRVGLYARP